MTEGFKTSAGGDVWGTSDPWTKPKAPNLYHAPCIQTTEYLIFTFKILRLWPSSFGCLGQICHC